LRDVEIELPLWTTCRNLIYQGFERPEDDTIQGPLYAIVCEIKSGRGGYGEIPYFDGCRVNTVSDVIKKPRWSLRKPPSITVVRFTDTTGKQHEFQTVAEYLAFYRASGREL